MNLWGAMHDLPFEIARARGVVPEQELRALTLLASLSDPARFGFYMQYGMYPAMGNLSKRIYLVRRFETVMETDDGSPVASWCVVTRDRWEIPETDHVVALKNIIEGEELAFREIGNRGNFYNMEGPLTLRTSRGRVAFPMPFRTPFMDPAEPDSYDPLRLKKDREEAALKAQERYEDAVEQATRRPWEKTKEAQPSVQGNVVLGYAGASGWNGTAGLRYIGDDSAATTNAVMGGGQNAVTQQIVASIRQNLAPWIGRNFQGRTAP